MNSEKNMPAFCHSGKNDMKALPAWNCLSLPQLKRTAVLLLFGIGLLFAWSVAVADTVPALYNTFAGNVNFVGTQKTLRTGDNTNTTTASSLVSGATTPGGSSATTATLSGLPASGTNTILAAYLYWAGSGTTPDYTVTFEGSAVTASRTYTITNTTGVTGKDFFSGVADVTSAVIAKGGNGTYTFSGLTVNAGEPWYSSQNVLGGWALFVVYKNPTVERFRVLNVYEGFQRFYGSDIPLTISNFRTPASNIDGKLAHLTWEGDVTNSTSQGGYSERLAFNNNTLTDANNPSNNQFNSVSTIRAGAVDSASYGIDFDAYDISAYMSPGATTATSVYSSGADLVLLSMEVISVTNTPVADLAIAMGLNGTTFVRGQNSTYTINVSNNGPNSETGPITVTDTLPAGLSFVSGSGTGWSCSAVGQAVTCTYSGGSLASGASAPALTLTVGVTATASGTIANSATVAGVDFDNVSANNTATDSHAVAVADLALTMVRNGTLISGQTISYTLNVSNGGPSNETGPITVTDPLPSGFSFVSATGTGWSCDAVVTCTYSGSLASGASAPAISLITTVGGSGSVTNTATVAGFQYDSNAGNNTASDTSVVLPAAYAYYPMDESEWNQTAGEVKDLSGNNRHATTIATSGSVSTVAAVAAGLKGDTCRAGSIPVNTSAATVQAVDTGITINNLGTAGTISFWYRNNVAWNATGNANDRTLLDATGSAGSREFWLVLEDGALRFALDNGSGNLQTASGTVQTFAADTWHHIAITWDFSASVHTMIIYVDGTQNGIRNNTAVTANANYGAIYIGDSKSTRYTNPNRGNSANGIIDEARIYSGVLTAAQIAVDMNASHSCLDHYELSLPTNSITCLASTVTVTACADSSSPCTNKSGSVSGRTAALDTNAGTLAATTVVFDATGVATTTLSYPTAINGAAALVTLDGEQVVATNSRKCCPDGVSCSVANSCSTTFSTTGFIFSGAANGAVATISNQVAASSSGTYYLRAVKTGTTTKACEAALTGTTPVNFAYECNDPISCSTGNLMSVNGGAPTAITGNSNGSVASYTPVNMTFDANGNAPFTFNYSDVGLVKLWVAKPPSGLLLSTLAGSSNPFVVKPDHFDLSNIKRTADNVPNPIPAATDASGTAFIQAGDNFRLTVKAMSAVNTPTPNYGKETTAQGVRLVQTLVAPTGAGTSNPALTNGVIGGVEFGTTGQINTDANGEATVTNLAWNEVGIITLAAIADKAGENDYLGSGSVAGATTGETGNIGRFYPHHFVAGSSIGTRSDLGCAPASSFTYMREPMLLTLNLTAQNATNGTTQNYFGDFAKLDGATVSKWVAFGSNDSIGLGAVDGTNALSARLSISVPPIAPSVPTSAWAAGNGTLTAHLVLDRGASPDGPFDNLKLGIAPQDADGVKLLSGALDLDADLNTSLERKAVPDATAVPNTTKVRYGRIRLNNAHGSELLPLPIPLKAEYFRTGFGFVTNTDDSCTSFVLAPAVSNTPINYQYGDLWLSNPLVNMTVTASVPTFNPIALGQSNIRLSAPGAGNNGSIDLRLIVPPWLQFAWGGGNLNPGARATFGVYKGNNNFIYLRENY